MAMMKMCRCGKLIDYYLKSCIECEELYSKDNRAKHSLYNRYQRDEGIQKIYNNKQWTIVKQRAEFRDNNLCILCLSNKTIKSSQAVHHIIELKEDISKAFDLNNLICLCESCHQSVHNKYKRSDKLKEETQSLLLTLITKDVNI
ncbi:HNH endonuclease [Tissierella creatinophila DSM 6911]|uniref:Putative HNH nuclease YajD n=2 Tax=Tissierella creatinophila TaxID=79681 RepID=A0A1U7M6E4_TISCR|nr:HNH endonuclease [Tissierella creatinophila DSM 6911]